MAERLRAVVDAAAALEVRRGLKEYLLEKILVAAATAAMSQWDQGAMAMMADVEDIKWGSRHGSRQRRQSNNARYCARAQAQRQQGAG